MQYYAVATALARGTIGSKAESDTCLVVVTVFKIVAPALCVGGWVRFPPSPPSSLAPLVRWRLEWSSRDRHRFPPSFLTLLGGARVVIAQTASRLRSRRVRAIPAARVVFLLVSNAHAAVRDRAATDGASATERGNRCRSRRAVARRAKREDHPSRHQASGASENGGEGGNRTHPTTQSVEATILKTVTTTRHVSLSAFDPMPRPRPVNRPRSRQ